MDDWEASLTCVDLDSITTHEKERLVYATQPLPPSLRYAFLDES